MIPSNSRSRYCRHYYNLCLPICACNLSIGIAALLLRICIVMEGYLVVNTLDTVPITFFKRIDLKMIIII